MTDAEILAQREAVGAVMGHLVELAFLLLAAYLVVLLAKSLCDRWRKRRR